MSRPVKLGLICIAVAAAIFLVSFLPEYIRANALERKLEDARVEADFAHVRDLAGAMFLQTSFKNYGLASRYAAAFFNGVKELASQEQPPGRQAAWQDILAKRDAITSELARGDASAYGSVQSVYAAVVQQTPGLSP